MMTADQCAAIRDGISARFNIVVSGGTGSGKTTLANAILNEMVSECPEHRLVILEDCKIASTRLHQGRLSAPGMV